jgi:hypothetical protein
MVAKEHGGVPSPLTLPHAMEVDKLDSAARKTLCDGLERVAYCRFAHDDLLVWL